MAQKAPKPPPLVDATWVGTFEGELEDGTVLVPGETTVKLPKPEAEESENWKVKGRKKSSSKKSSSKAPDPAPSEPTQSTETGSSD